MKTILIAAIVLASISAAAQPPALNTAKNCTYMAPIEKEMIYEINRLRSNPTSYLEYLIPLLKDAQYQLDSNGKGGRNYSLTFGSHTIDGVETKYIDTTWNYINEEEVHALTTLIDTLKGLKPLSILLPDPGIYTAAKNYAKDQNEHEWKLLHQGSDGSWPWDRIKRSSPTMGFGNENIGAITGYPTARDIVLLLLIDSGIPGYGHRYNILNAQWGYIACRTEQYNGSAWWLQEFGSKKK